MVTKSITTAPAMLRSRSCWAIAGAASRLISTGRRGARPGDRRPRRCRHRPRTASRPVRTALPRRSRARCAAQARYRSGRPHRRYRKPALRRCASGRGSSPHGGPSRPAGSAPSCGRRGSAPRAPPRDRAASVRSDRARRECGPRDRPAAAHRAHAGGAAPSAPSPGSHRCAAHPPTRLRPPCAGHDPALEHVDDVARQAFALGLAFDAPRESTPVFSG